MQRTSIEWTDMSVNMVRSRRVDTGRLGHHCVKISPGCANCYSEAWNGWRGNGLPFTVAAAERAGMFLDRDALQKLLRRRKPARVFVEDMSDLFGDWVPDEWLDAIYAAMAICRHMTFQVLTKRSVRMRDYLSRPMLLDRWGMAACDLLGTPDALGIFEGLDWPPPNIWHGVSVEDQKRADERIPHLLATPAAVRFLSCEPLLGPVDLGRYLWTKGELATANSVGMGWSQSIGWVIVGGESGPKARPMDPDWARSVIRQCAAAGVPAFMKQMGSRWASEAQADAVIQWEEKQNSDAPEWAGPRPEIDRKGGDWSRLPEDLRVREFPGVVAGTSS